MTPEQIEYLIYQYDQRAMKGLKDDNKSEWRRYSAQAKRLKKWRDEDGAAEPCPVNYEEDGLTLDGARNAGVHVENLNVILEQPVAPEKVEAESRTDDATEGQAAEVEVERPLKPAQMDRADSLYNEANEAFKKEDWSKAKQLAEQLARLGDSRGEEIITAVDLRSGDGGNKVDAGTLYKIKIALREYNHLDIQSLGNAVRDAEQIRARGQADEELLDLLKNARERWGEMRKSHSNFLTRGRRFGAAGYAESVEDLEALIIANQITVWDPTTATYMEASHKLAEVRHEWEQVSREAVNREIEDAQKHIPHYLDLAKKKLEDVYNLTFYSSKEKLKPESERKPTGFAYHKQERYRIYGWLEKVEAMIAQRDKAEKLVERARSATSPEQALDFLLDARSQWQHLAGLEQQITELRENIAKLLTERMQNKIAEAKVALLEAIAKVETVEQIVREHEEIRRMR